MNTCDKLHLHSTSLAVIEQKENQYFGIVFAATVWLTLVLRVLFSTQWQDKSGQDGTIQDNALNNERKQEDSKGQQQRESSKFSRTV